MVYFIVNNNYQFYDVEIHLVGLNKSDVKLIEIPHTLDEREHLGFRSVFRYLPALQVGLIAQVKNYLQLIKRIDQDIIPSKEDILFFYTEFEILNQYVATRFKQAGARVYLIQDGSVGTYLPFRMVCSEPLTLKWYVKQSIYRLLPGLSRIRLHKLNGVIFPWMPDTSIDGVCIYRQVTLKRAISPILLQFPSQSQLSLVPDRIIFLNEAIYGLYQTAEKYIEGLDKIIGELCSRFDEVFFKFHPRETDEWRQRIRQEVLFRFPAVIVIEENTAIEMMIEQYHPFLVASYFCAALLSLPERGIESLYLYHLIPELNEQPIFQELTSVLNELGYNFVSDFSEVNSEYKSGLLRRSISPHAITLADLVAQR